MAAARVGQDAAIGASRWVVAVVDARTKEPFPILQHGGKLTVVAKPGAEYEVQIGRRSGSSRHYKVWHCWQHHA